MRFSIKDYENIHFSPNALFLYLNRLLIQIGSGVLSVFGVIFFFEEFGKSVEKVLLLYGLLYLTYTLVTHIGAKFLDTIGMRVMMIIAVFFLTASVVARFLWQNDPTLFLILFFLFIAVYKMFYWVPYHVEFAEFTDKKTRGRQVAILSNISSAILAVMPVISGLILSVSGYDILFLVSSAIIFLSVIPLYYIEETHEKYTWKVGKLIKEFFQKENRSIVVSQLGNGAQDAVRAVIWPIFIFLILEGDYLSIGLVTSLTVLALIIIRFIIGDLMDKWGKEGVLKWGSIVYMSGWIIKMFIETGTGIFLSDTYHRLGQAVNKMSIDTEVYEQAADNGHYVDEYTVLKETALLIGKGGMLLLSVLIISLYGLTATFVAAAIATLMMTTATHKVQIQ